MSAAGPPALQSTGDDTYACDGVRFTYTHRRGSTVDHFHIRKPLELAQALADLLAGHQGANLVELGVAQGGSTALTALLADPARLVAVELDPTPVPALAEFLVARGLADRVQVHHGVDQGDRPALTAIVDDGFGDEPLDLVLDDASHLLGPTRSSFDVLFPRLRSGGAYVIEDWCHDQQMADRLWEQRRGEGQSREQRIEARMATALADPTHPDHAAASAEFAAHLASLAQDGGSEARAAQDALSAAIEAAAADPSHPRHAEVVAQLAAPVPAGAGAPVPVARASADVLLRFTFELVLAHIARPDLIAGLAVDRWWVVVRRGPAAVDGEGFRLADHFRDHFSLLR